MKISRERETDKMDQISIGKYIAEKRRALNLTQEQLAETLCVSNKTTQHFNDYSGAERRNTSKTHETPPQNCSAAGFVYVPK